MELPVSRPAATRVILNPASSGGLGAGMRGRVEEELSRRCIPFSLSLTQAPGHARTLATEAAQEGVTRILAVGGDGTVHEIANGLLAATGSPPPMAVVPVGTGNDFFRMVGVPRRLDRALDVLQAGEVRYFDVGRVSYQGTDTHFVNLLGIGVDVEVIRRREGFRHLKGLLQYLAALGAALTSFRPEEIRASLEGVEPGDGAEVIQGRTLLTTVTVGPSVGGGFLVSPQASPEDGLLDFFFVEALGVTKIVRYIPRVIRGTHGDLSEVRLRRFRKGLLERTDGEPFFFELDGERMPQAVTRLEMEVCPRRLPVLVPRRES
ncbi:diacylglycerol/lipid kinase family protein [Gemmatimonadota bacterium]